MSASQPIPTPAASASHPIALPASTPPASASSYSRSPPRPLLSPLLSRTAFTLPTPAAAAHHRSRSFSSSPPDEAGPTTPLSSPPAQQPQLGSSFSGAPLGRVPSAGYGSYGAASGYALGRVPSGNSAAMMAYSPETEHKAMGLLRRFSLSGSGAVKPSLNSAPATQQIGFERHGRSASVASTASTTSIAGTAAAEPRSAPAMVDPALAAQARGRKGSVGGNGKRRPSPMGERLLMGHFNAH
ncbi:hypothetical protein FA09DRAFT_335768 [Tilletiopsis washingtonensis]|uniref:Uncharacterized protein n=1 Tax=Tilletiopsis washingtonensis TaxID=58919 RepID=A0A316ZLD5_9BASI|nr:hypothetical protein FA09DRAFT_335768 [Tilletiopsis washingtonensis]PWO01134.1 hypothetical protein FA09DRAFT_335768 [Tilletiopsis washingtonensis]